MSVHSYKMVDAVPPEEEVSISRSITNKMGFLACTSYVIGNIIGSGIFITPTDILNYTQSIGLSLIVWIGCGIISIIGAICYIELGTSIPEPGCDFAYTMFVGWRGLAFSFMWVSCILTYPASAAVQAKTFGSYLVTGFSPLFQLEEPWNTITERLLALFLIVSITILNFFSIERFAARFQVIVTIAKVLIVGIIIATGFYYLIFQGWTQNLAEPMAGSVWAPGKLSLAFYGGLWSYAGWDVLNYGTPEIHKPRRTMPLSLLTGIVTVAVIYVLINISYFIVLTPDQMKNSTAVAADFAHVALGGFSYAVPFMIAVLLIGTMNSNLFCGSRFMHAAARSWQLPPFLSVVNKESGSPRAALLGQMIASIIVCTLDISTLINYVTFVMWGQRVVTICALLYLRYAKLEVARDAIRVPLLLSFVFLLISVSLVVIPFAEEPWVTSVGAILVFGGFIFYMALMRPNWNMPWVTKVNDALSSAACRLLNSELDMLENQQEAAPVAAAPDAISVKMEEKKILGTEIQPILAAEETPETPEAEQESTEMTPQ